MAEKYLTLKESAAILSVSTRTLAGLAISGQISAYHLPSYAGVKCRWRFKLCDIESFMDIHKFNSINVATKNAFKANKALIDIKKNQKGFIYMKIINLIGEENINEYYEELAIP